jgi:hypothetical protein
MPLLASCTWLFLELVKKYRPGIVGILFGGHFAIALGYWLAIDLPRARNDRTQWPGIEAMAASIQEDFGPVLACNVPPEGLSMIQLAVDRRLQERPPGTAIEPQVKWIVATQKEKTKGFVEQATTGPYRLLRRQVD